MTVLANEQAIDGKGWRSGAEGEKRKLNQWFLKITDFAEELLDGLGELEDWPDKVRLMQENWIGKSRSLEFSFELSNGESLPVYTTRPDTIFGSTFVAVAPDHPVAQCVAAQNCDAAKLVERCKRGGTTAAELETAEKLGFDTGIGAKPPFTGEHLPVFIANFVLMDYGTGAIMAVPGHDQRAFEFATKYGLPIPRVVAPDAEEADKPFDGEPEAGEGVLVDSGFLDGMEVEDAKREVIARAESGGWGKGRTVWRLRDRGVSRQRYWGTPIPFIHCETCGVVPVPKEQLPVVLPEDVDFQTPGNPLLRHPSWKHVDCPTCGARAERETDTLDTFVDSSWYFLRFASQPGDKPFDREEVAKWLPVEQYMTHETYSRSEGGKTVYYAPDEISREAEHALLKDDGGEVEIGRVIKMSKSKKNTVDPDEIVAKYGSDAVQWFMLSDSPTERDLPWSEARIEGCWRFVQRLWRLFGQYDAAARGEDRALDRQVHKAVAAAAQDIEALSFNKAVARIYELTSAAEKAGPSASRSEAIRTILLLASPMMPHLAEETWAAIGGKDLIANASWPEVDPALLVEDEVTIAVRHMGKLRDTLIAAKGAPEEDHETIALASDKVRRSIDGAEIRKVLVVPDRLVNIVT